MKNFIAHTDNVRQEMLKDISCSSVEDLFKQLPVLFKNFDMENPLSEMDTQKKVRSLAGNNKTNYISFVGGGVYNKYVPACISNITQRFEFLTAL